MLLVDRHIWRRWRLVLACAALLALGMSVYAYIPIRALIPPEPPLFYARPNTFERFRYLVFAEQFHDLFDPLANPFAQLRASNGPMPTGGARAPVHRSRLADGRRRRLGPGRPRPARVRLPALLVLANVVYSMNYIDGDIARYYMLTVLVGAVMIGVGISAVAAAAGACHGRCQPTDASPSPGRRRAAIADRRAGAGRRARCCPRAACWRAIPSEPSRAPNRDADRWVESVYHAVPENAVVISWWSYSTPLWYHRWVLGERPDVAIIDERNILDDGLRYDRSGHRPFLGKRPVYVVPPFWELDRLVPTWETETIPTYSGYTDLLRVEGPR